ncbi:MAG: competence/damage-inducible protein A [Verrucomicrobiales bacterium]
MKIEILNTGNELLLGTTRNTHGTWIGQELLKHGLRVQRQTTVPDGPAIAQALAEALTRSDALIITGGLGPTSDDLTRESAAEVLGIELMEDEAALRSLEAYFEARGKVMAESNRKQAQSLVGADILPNANGTAPGIYVPPRLSPQACALFLLPGPPRELYPMFHAEVTPRLRALAGIEGSQEIEELKFVGVGESTLQQEVDADLSAISGLEHGYCARLGEVDVRLIGSPAARAQATDLLAARFSEYLVNRDGASLEASTLEALKARSWKLATAESCTGGLIASRLTDIPGSSAVLTHGFVTYANEAKSAMLGVSPADLDEHGAVSAPVARQMAEGALEKSGADLAIAVTGIAGPDGGSAEKPVGTVWLALARKGRETRVWQENHPILRADFKWMVSQSALDALRRATKEA